MRTPDSELCDEAALGFDEPAARGGGGHQRGHADDEEEGGRGHRHRKGWNLYVCGNGGMRPRHAVLLAEDLDRETLIRVIDRFLMFYKGAKAASRSCDAS